MASTIRQAITVVLDCGRYMDRAFEPEKTRFDVALASLETYLQQKMMFSTRDEIGLVCYGTDATDNDCHDETGDYTNIVSARGIHVVDLDMVRFLRSLQVCQQDSDLLGALIVGIDLLSKKTKGKKYVKTIFVLSGGDCNVDGAEDGQKAAALLQDNDVAFRYVDISGTHIQEAAVPRNDAQQLVSQFLSVVCEEVTDSHVIPVERLQQMLNSFKPRTILQRSKCRLNLELTEQIKIAVWLYIASKEETIPSLKSHSKVASEDSDGKVRMDRSYFPANNIAEEEVEAGDRIKAYAYGRHLVPITQADAAALKYQSGERVLAVLGSIPLHKLERHLMIGAVECVAAEPNNEAAAFALDCLTTAMRKSKLALMCRYVWRKNADPRLTVLTPSGNKCCLYLNYVPFKEDIVNLTFPPLPKVQNVQQLEAVDELIDSMSLMPEEGSGIEEELLVPECTVNPTLQRFYRLVMNKGAAEQTSTQSSVRTDNFEADLLKIPVVDPRIQARSKRSLQLMSSSFKLGKAEKLGGKKLRSWRDAAQSRAAAFASIDNESATDVDDIRLTELGGDDDTGAAASATVRTVDFASLKIGTVRPVEDLDKMIATDDNDTCQRGFEEMKVVVRRIIREAVAEGFMVKVTNCVAALRNAAVNIQTAEEFNSFLNELRSTCESHAQYSVYWRGIQKQDILPISAEEDPTSSVLPRDAAKYYEDADNREVKATQQSTAAPDDLDDDLLDLID